MPLQIRRGTNAERLAMTQKLAAGEPLWITDQSKLYIGDGTTATPSLLPVTGFTTQDAQDAAASLFTTATHSGISFTYNNVAHTLVANVNLATYSGSIKGDLTGSVFADNSTMLVDGNAGVIHAEVLTGTFTGNVVGNLTGNVSGNVTGTLSGDVTGNVYGDVHGSVFGNDSTLIFDAIDSVLDVRKIKSASGSLQIGTSTDPTLVSFSSNNTSEIVNFKGITNGSSAIPFLNIRTSRGTLAAPTTTAVGDILTGLTIQGYANGDYQAAATIYAAWESTATLTNPNPGATVTIATGNNAGSTSSMTFNSIGALQAPVFQLTNYADDTARTAAIATPVKGMLIFMVAGTTPAATNKVQVYNGSAWENLT